MHRSTQLALLCLFLYVGTAAACSCLCVGSSSLDKPDCGCCKYKVVAVGQVQSIVATGGLFGSFLVNILISEEIRDKNNDITVGAIEQFTTQQSTAACGFPFTVGSTYIIYVWDGSSGLGVSLCSATQLYSASGYVKAKSSCSFSGLYTCGITNTFVSAAAELSAELTTNILPPAPTLTATLQEAVFDVSIIKFPKKRKPCPKGTFRAECEAEITGQVPGFDYSNDPFVRVGYDCNGPWAILGDQNGDGFYDSCIVCPDGTEAMDLDGDGAEEVCSCPDPKEDICGQCPGLDYSKFLDPANTNGIVFCKPNDFDCGKNAILADLDCAVDENGDPSFEVCQLCPDGTQAFDSDNDGCEDKCVPCVPYKTFFEALPVSAIFEPAASIGGNPILANASIINDVSIVSPFIPPNKPCPPGWIPAPCEDAIFGLPFYLDYSEQLADICPDENLCGVNAILGDSNLDGIIDVCILCPFPLVAKDLDGDGCKETCDCSKPIIGVIQVTPFLDTLIVADPTTGVSVSASATKLKAPSIEKGICNLCPNIPFYNSDFCTPGLDCGPFGILGDVDCDGVFDVCYECPDGTFPIDTNGDGCEDCCSECIPIDPVKGACCDKNTGGCTELTEEGCESIDGLFTAGVSCSDVNCKTPLGACCVSDGCIEATTADNCKKQMGTFFQSKKCEEVDEICNPTTGACCVADVDGFAGLNPPCFEGPQTQCPGKYFPSLSCSDIEKKCRRRGACCFEDGGCGVVYESQCTGDSVFFPNQFACTPNLCPEIPTGACCNAAGCTTTTVNNCQGQFFYGASCDEVNDICFPDPVLISCCLNGQCIFDGIDSPDLRAECTASGGTVIIGDCTSADCPVVDIVSCCVDSQCVYEGPFNPFVITECETLGGVYFEGECAFNNGCEDPNQDVFSCCLDGQCLLESPFLWVVQELCDTSGGNIFQGPCSENEDCNRGSCCLPTGDCQDGFLSDEFIMDCKSEGGFISDGPCSETCGSEFACCLPNGNCVDGTLTAANSQKCLNNGGTLFPDKSCNDVDCPIDDKLVSCCVDGQCKYQGPPNVGLEKKCKAEGGTFIAGPCTPDVCPNIISCCLPDGNCFDGPPNIGIEQECDFANGVLQTGSCSDVECAAPPPPPVGGACCRSDGSCTQTVPGSCDGQFFAGLTCDDIADECPVFAACCFGSTCVEQFGPSGVQGLQLECQISNGIFFPGQVCTPDLCLGACCLEDGTCEDRPASECDPAVGGIVFLPGATCNDPTAPPECPSDPPTACCLPSGICVTVPSTECVDADGNVGVVLPGQTCNQPNICPSNSPLPSPSPPPPSPPPSPPPPPPPSPPPPPVTPVDIVCCGSDGTCGPVPVTGACNGQIFTGISCAVLIATGECPAISACCLPDGTCFEGGQGVDIECEFANGVLNPGQRCSDVACGFCCDTEGQCFESTAQECDDVQGCYSSLADDCENPACEETCQADPCTGDVDSSKSLTVSDLVIVIEIVVSSPANACSFDSVQPPFNQQECCGPKLGCVISAGDVTNDNTLNIQDVTNIVACIVGSDVSTGCLPCLR